MTENSKYHIVRPGDTLWIIAQKYGVSVELLYALNPRIDAYKLQVGQRISIGVSQVES
jgi:LysM repeat protein